MDVLRIFDSLLSSTPVNFIDVPEEKKIMHICDAKRCLCDPAR